MEKLEKVVILIFLAAIPLVFSPLNYYVFEIPKLTLLVTFALLLSIIRMLKNLKTSETSRENPILFFLLIIIFPLISLVHANLFGPFLNLKEFILFITVLYLLYFFSTMNPDWFPNMIFTLVVVFTLISLYGILQNFGIDFKFWGGNLGKKTVFSTIGNPNTAAEATLFLIPLFYFVCHIKNFKLKLKPIFMVIPYILILFSFLCLSKGAILSFFASLVILILFKFKTIKKLNNKNPIVAFFIISIIVFFTSISLLKPLNINDFISQFNTKSASSKNRIFIYHTSLRIIKQYSFIKKLKRNSFIGTGVGSFEYIYTEHILLYNLIENEKVDPFAVLVKRAHNEFLQIGIEFGVVGILILFLFWFLIIKMTSALSSKNPFFIYILWSLVFVLFDSLFNFPFHNISLLLIFSMVIGYLLSINRYPRTKDFINVKFFAFIPMIVLIILFIFQLRIFKSDFLLQKANMLIAHDQIEDAKIYLVKSCQLNPQNSVALANLGSIELSMKNYSEAEKNLTNSLRFSLQDKTFFNRSLLSFEEFNLQNAITDIVVAMKLNPYVDSYYSQLAVTNYLLGDYESSYFNLKSIGSLTPKDHFLLMKLAQYNNQIQLNNEELVAYNTDDLELKTMVLRNTNHLSIFDKILQNKFNKNVYDLLLLSSLRYYSGKTEDAREILKLIVQKPDAPKSFKLIAQASLYETYHLYPHARELYKQLYKNENEIDFWRLDFKEGEVKKFINKDITKLNSFSLPFFMEDYYSLNLYYQLFKESDKETLINCYRYAKFYSAKTPLFKYFAVYFDFLNHNFSQCYKDIFDQCSSTFFIENSNETNFSIIPIFISFNEDNEDLKNNIYILEVQILRLKKHQPNFDHQKVLFYFNLYLNAKKKSFNKLKSILTLEKRLRSNFEKLKDDDSCLDLALFYYVSERLKDSEKTINQVKNKNNNRFLLYQGLIDWFISKKFEPPNSLVLLANKEKYSLNFYILFAQYLVYSNQNSNTNSFNYIFKDVK